ncbi:hypothetical protein IG612_05035 [Pectobacterium sp. FL60-S17]|uniref:Uncharacterized protein n=1 Tax=Pectobacterium quasiaquaticum TaxID=2774015 RepID=A0A9Q2IGU6_9GAMM|nr:hypothetical protein [Pectobacterium quasiaquaticum]MBE5201990.1 hypothetical protein [Pectobacterium quasiaquaticum]MBE5208822.1 hypothetical protein [Pectobacterium quasiaquaticum]MBE5223056.1 hypothetical protein [Pectobacterium quasiaquaticum]URG50858.1 hypothetical protein IG609_010340 [Pectobacterium quasiaquaticum]
MIKNIRNCCRRRWLLLRSVDAVYHWIGISSLAILLFKVVVLNDIPAPVRFMSSVSPVVEGVLGSVIASYIFYLLCIHPPIFAAKKTTADFEHSILLRIKLSFESHLRGISPTLNYDSTEQEIYAVFLALAPSSKTSPLGVPGDPSVKFDWFIYFQDSNQHIHTNVMRLLDSRLALDIETINTLNKISSCTWFSIIARFANINVGLPRGGNPFVNASQPDGALCRCFYELKELIRSLQPAIDAAAKLKDQRLE